MPDTEFAAVPLVLEDENIRRVSDEKDVAREVSSKKTSHSPDNRALSLECQSRELQLMVARIAVAATNPDGESQIQTLA
jgi:hypothetical protein